MQDVELQFNPNAHNTQDIQDVLKARRCFLHMTQQQVASAAGISFQQYQKFEGGYRNITTASFLVACKVLEALQMDIPDFYHHNYNTERVPDTSYYSQPTNYLITTKSVKVIPTKNQIKIVIKLT